MKLCHTLKYFSLLLCRLEECGIKLVDWMSHSIIAWTECFGSRLMLKGLKLTQIEHNFAVFRLQRVKNSRQKPLFELERARIHFKIIIQVRFVLMRT